MDGNAEIAVNPEFVAAVTPAGDGKGVPIIGVQAVHLKTGQVFPVRGNLGSICQALESHRRVLETT
jgi:hypothetical protein